MVTCGVDAPCLEPLEYHGTNAVVAAAAQVVGGLGVQALDVALAWRLPGDARGQDVLHGLEVGRGGRSLLQPHC